MEECSFLFYFDKPTNDLSSTQANYNGYFEIPRGPNLQRTTRVGVYPSNKLGLYDMHGNVCQWTSSAEGRGWVSRGGGWHHFGSAACSAAFRDVNERTDRRADMGFRLARVPVRQRSGESEGLRSP